MSVLDTFFILFKTDAKEAQKEIEGADKAAVDLSKSVDKVGKVDTSGLSDMRKELDAAAVSAQGLGTALEANAAIPAANAATTTPPAAPSGTPQSGLKEALDKAGAISPQGIEALTTALSTAKMNARELAQEAQRAKFDGRPNAADVAEQARKAALDTKELELAVTRAKSELKGAATEATHLDNNLDKANANAKKLGTSFTEFAEAMVIPLAGFAALGAAFNLGMSRIKPVADIGDQSGKLRSSAQDYDAFTRSVRASGGSIEDAKSNLIKFNDKLNDAVNNVKGPAAKEFAKWGIQFKDVKGHALGAVDGILSLSKSLEKISQAEAIARLKKLGINDAATIALILQGKNAIVEKMNAEKAAGVVTDEQIRIAGEYQNELGATQNMLDSFGNKVMELVIPAVTSMMALFREAFTWLINHKVLVEGFFIGVALAVTAYFLPAMTAAALAVIAATWPFLLIGAAIASAAAAFALLYEDIVAFMTGEPSEIGVLAEKYKWFGEVVKGIGTAVKIMVDTSISAWEALTQAVQIAAQAFIDTWNAVSPTLSAIIDGYIDIFTRFWSAIGAGAKALITSLEPVWAALKEAGSLIVDVVNDASTKIEEDVGRIRDRFIERFNEIKESVTSAVKAMYDDAKPIFDRIVEAASLIKDAFVSAFEAIARVWNATIGAIADGIRSTVEAARNMRGPMALDPGSAGAQMGALFGGPQALQNATNNPMGATTPGAIAAANVDNSKTQTITTGPISIQTQATDAQGIAAGIRDGLRDELKTTISNFDDGVAK